MGERLGALADLLALVTSFDLPTGRMEIPHPTKQYSVQGAAYRLGIPFTVHPGIGYDIIYTHPLNSGGAIGRGAVRDFLSLRRKRAQPVRRRASYAWAPPSWRR